MSNIIRSNNKGRLVSEHTTYVIVVNKETKHSIVITKGIRNEVLKT